MTQSKDFKDTDEEGSWLYPGNETKSDVCADGFFDRVPGNMSVGDKILCHNAFPERLNWLVVTGFVADSARVELRPKPRPVLAITPESMDYHFPPNR